MPLESFFDPRNYQEYSVDSKAFGPEVNQPKLNPLQWPNSTRFLVDLINYLPEVPEDKVPSVVEMIGNLTKLVHTTY